MSATTTRLPLAAARDLEQRFWSKVARVDDDSSCWLWTGAKSSDGYGSFRVAGRTLGAHVVAYMLAHDGAKPEDETCHSCEGKYSPGDVTYRACVRNDGDNSHLRDDTHRNNALDCLRNGRGNRARGDRNGSRVHIDRMPRGDMHPSRLRPDRIARGERIANHRLTAATVTEIRARYASGGVFQRELAREHKVNLSTIQRLLAGQTWAM